MWSPSVMGMARDGVFSTCQQEHLYANAKQALVRLIRQIPLSACQLRERKGGPTSWGGLALLVYSLSFFISPSLTLLLNVEGGLFAGAFSFLRGTVSRA